MREFNNTCNVLSLGKTKKEHRERLISTRLVEDTQHMLCHAVFCMLEIISHLKNNNKNLQGLHAKESGRVTVPYSLEFHLQRDKNEV